MYFVDRVPLFRSNNSVGSIVSRGCPRWGATHGEGVQADRGCNDGNRLADVSNQPQSVP